MAPSNHLPKLKIALLFGATLMPTLSFAQSAQVSPLPKAPPEIMLKESREPKACAPQQGLIVGQDNKLQSTETTASSLSEQLERSDGVICPPPGVDPGIRAPTPEGGRMMPVIPPPGSPGGDPNIRPK